MVISTPLTPATPKSQKHLSETCRLWQQECLRAWLEMKQDIAEVEQDQIKLNPVQPTPQHPQSRNFSHNE